MTDSNNLNVIVGLGASGLSSARYLKKLGIPIAINDTRQNPPHLEEFKKEFPDVLLSLGKLDENLLSKSNKIIISPGISTSEPAIANQISKGTPVIGDIELFAQKAKAPIIAITGTNAKSTVTTLVGRMATASNLNAGVGGNLGIPALDLLSLPNIDLFVLELSSFQLETTYSLAPKVAAILNITPDHLDRYATLKHYSDTKHRIYLHTEMAVSNRDNPETECQSKVKKLYFTLNDPNENEFGLFKKNAETYLAFEDQILMPVKELPILGRHYQANALASLAIGYAYGFPMDRMLQTLKEFMGLTHRCQLIRKRKDVCWYNDSKGTNVGATLAAIEGLGPEIKGQLILIAGGVGKNADFSPLVPAIEKFVKKVILIGEAAPVLANVLGDRIDICFAKTMDEAVYLADAVSSINDGVLLSPACASYDMFNHFEHRGDVFTQLVMSLEE